MSHSLQEELLALHRRSEAPTASEINLMLNYDGEDLQTLYHCANELRQAYVGSEIYAHGTVVVSNMCDKNCAHCSMRHANSKLERYCLSQAEVANLAHQGLHYGCTTIVLQSGETEAMDTEMVCTTVDRIKIMPNLAVTAAFGVRPYNDYRFFRANGCDRYYLPFKTADRATFAELFPDMNLDEHLDSLYEARHSGMQIGSGFLVGLPDRELKLTAEDIRFTTQLDLDFIDCVPFFSHPDTPLAHKTFMKDVEIYFKTIAILRLLNPYAHITTSLLYNALSTVDWKNR